MNKKSLTDSDQWWAVLSNTNNISYQPHSSNNNTDSQFGSHLHLCNRHWNDIRSWDFECKNLSPSQSVELFLDVVPVSLLLFRALQWNVEQWCLMVQPFWPASFFHNFLMKIKVEWRLYSLRLCICVSEHREKRVTKQRGVSNWLITDGPYGAEEDQRQTLEWTDGLLLLSEHFKHTLGLQHESEPNSSDKQRWRTLKCCT